MIELSIYLGFLLLVSIVYYLVNNKIKHIVLLLSSIIFISYFSWEVAVFAVVFSSFNYLFGILIENYCKNNKKRLWIFWSAIVLDVGFLSFIKFFDVLYNGIIRLAESVVINSDSIINSIIIPSGISYYTFQALGYIISINRGSEKPEKDYLKFLTYLLFFPKFISGPVERSNHFFPQIRNLGSFNKETVSLGLRLFLWGAFKKIVIANNLSWFVYQIYNNAHDYSGFSLILVFFVQTIYIYMEFSGYTDMALGSAKILGINLIDNFNRPFLAKSVSDFWRRWHISLSSWCNDFIYSPFMVKYRKNEHFAIVAGVFLTFLIIGIWHAANWTFVVLGILQGIALVYEFYSKKFRIKIASRFPKNVVTPFSRILVFCFVCFSMVFFFSHTISDAWYVLSNLFNINSPFDYKAIISISPLFYFALFIFVLIFIIEIMNEKGRNVLSIFLVQPFWVRFAGYGILILAICFSDWHLLPFEYMKF